MAGADRGSSSIRIAITCRPSQCSSQDSSCSITTIQRRASPFLRLASFCESHQSRCISSINSLFPKLLLKTLTRSYGEHGVSRSFFCNYRTTVPSFKKKNLRGPPCSSLLRVKVFNSCWERQHCRLQQ